MTAQDDFKTVPKPMNDGNVNLPSAGQSTDPQGTDASSTLANQSTSTNLAKSPVANPIQAQSTMQEEHLGEIDELEKKVKESAIPEDLKVKTEKMIFRLKRMARLGSYSGEYELIEKYADWIIKIPWNKFTKDNLDIKNASQILDKNHYGLRAVKDRILEYLSVESLTKSVLGVGSQDSQKPATSDMGKLESSSMHAPIICFVGIQGIGKTTMAKSIAESLGRKFVRISLGAMGNVTELKGQSRAYLGAEPGQIIKALSRTGVRNPLILLDEIDKVSGAEGRRADIMAALLEILDPEQNATFIDAYIDYPVDLSKVMFICTANNLGTLSTALLDRLEIIRFSSYSDEEKEQIAKSYLLPKVFKATGLNTDSVQFMDDVWPLVIRPLGFDAGIRQLERNLTTLCRKIARMIIEGKGEKFMITRENFRQFLPEDIGVYS